MRTIGDLPPGGWVDALRYNALRARTTLRDSAAVFPVFVRVNKSSVSGPGPEYPQGRRYRTNGGEVNGVGWQEGGQ